jgi:hypothetical protein
MYRKRDRITSAKGRNFASHIMSTSPEFSAPLWTNSTCKWLERRDRTATDVCEWRVLTIVELNQRADALIGVERAQQGDQGRSAQEDELQQVKPVSVKGDNSRGS